MVFIYSESISIIQQNTGIATLIDSFKVKCCNKNGIKNYFRKEVYSYFYKLISLIFKFRLIDSFAIFVVGKKKLSKLSDMVFFVIVRPILF